MAPSAHGTIWSSPSDTSVDDESMYTFNPDQLPRQRQLFYQLCDLKSDQLQLIIHANNGKETTCNVWRKVNWLPYVNFMW